MQRDRSLNLVYRIDWSMICHPIVCSRKSSFRNYVSTGYFSLFEVFLTRGIFYSRLLSYIPIETVLLLPAARLNQLLSEHSSLKNVP